MSVFADDPAPRVYGLPPGANFTADLAAGMRTRLGDQPPEALARVEVAINTARAARALAEAFESAAEAVFLPRIATFERFVDDPAAALPPAIDGLERRLTLTRLIDRMLTLDPSLGPPGAAGPLADTLARLLDEMHGAKASLSRLETAVEDVDRGGRSSAVHEVHVTLRVDRAASRPRGSALVALRIGGWTRRRAPHRADFSGTGIPQ